MEWPRDLCHFDCDHCELTKWTDGHPEDFIRDGWPRAPCTTYRRETLMEIIMHANADIACLLHRIYVLREKSHH